MTDLYHISGYIRINQSPEKLTPLKIDQNISKGSKPLQEFSDDMLLATSLNVNNIQSSLRKTPTQGKGVHPLHMVFTFPFAQIVKPTLTYTQLIAGGGRTLFCLYFVL